MTQRFSLDRQSFEQFLSAAALFQKLEKHAVVEQPSARDDSQSLAEFAETQQAIETLTLDLDSALSRIMALALKLTSGRGAAVWLFTRSEFVYRAGAGTATKDERLRLQVLSSLATAPESRKDALLAENFRQEPLGALVAADERSGRGDLIGEIDEEALDDVRADRPQIGHRLRDLLDLLVIHQAEEFGGVFLAQGQDEDRRPFRSGH